MRKLCILILFAVFVQSLQAQFSSSSSYFPLQVGNMWKYKKFSTGSGHDFTYLTVTITKDSIVGGIRSYYLHHDPPQSDYWITYDSLSGILHYGNQPGVPFLRLSASTGDTTNFVCIAEADTLHYNIPSRIKKYFKDMSAPHNIRGIEISLIKHFGQTYYHEYFNSPSGSTYVIGHLQGCVINGITHGDTSSIIGIQTISGSIPEQFSLSQNFPNPFNPVTQINFDLPKSGLVNITIYNSLGKEIEQIVSKELSTGSYSVDWDASFNPSGVYFYKLTAGEFTQTRKMVIIK